MRLALGAVTRSGGSSRHRILRRRRLPSSPAAPYEPWMSTFSRATLGGVRACQAVGIAAATANDDNDDDDDDTTQFTQ